MNTQIKHDAGTSEEFLSVGSLDRSRQTAECNETEDLTGLDLNTSFNHSNLRPGPGHRTTASLAAMIAAQLSSIALPSEAAQRLIESNTAVVEVAAKIVAECNGPIYTVHALPHEQSLLIGAHASGITPVDGNLIEGSGVYYLSPAGWEALGGRNGLTDRYNGPAEVATVSANSQDIIIGGVVGVPGILPSAGAAKWNRESKQWTPLEPFSHDVVQSIAFDGQGGIYLGGVLPVFYGGPYQKVMCHFVKDGHARDVWGADGFFGNLENIALINKSLVTGSAQDGDSSVIVGAGSFERNSRRRAIVNCFWADILEGGDLSYNAFSVPLQGTNLNLMEYGGKLLISGRDLLVNSTHFGPVLGWDPYQQFFAPIGKIPLTGDAVAVTKFTGRSGEEMIFMAGEFSLHNIPGTCAVYNGTEWQLLEPDVGGKDELDFIRSVAVYNGKGVIGYESGRLVEVEIPYLSTPEILTLQPFPNPARESGVSVSWGSGSYGLKGEIFDVTGRAVSEMTVKKGIGGNILYWDGTQDGIPVEAGTYLMRIADGSVVKTGRVVVVR